MIDELIRRWAKETFEFDAEAKEEGDKSLQDHTTTKSVEYTTEEQKPAKFMSGKLQQESIVKEPTNRDLENILLKTLDKLANKYKNKG